MFENEEEKTADFMYASLTGNYCLLQWYVASLLVVQKVLQREGADQLSWSASMQPFLA